MVVATVLYDSSSFVDISEVQEQIIKTNASAVGFGVQSMGGGGGGSSGGGNEVSDVSIKFNGMR